MAVLVEMGFGDRPLNQRLLNKYNYNLLDVVNELVQMSDNDWYTTRYWRGGGGGEAAGGGKSFLLIYSLTCLVLPVSRLFHWCKRSAVWAHEETSDQAEMQFEAVAQYLEFDFTLLFWKFSTSIRKVLKGKCRSEAFHQKLGPQIPILHSNDFEQTQSTDVTLLFVSTYRWWLVRCNVIGQLWQEEPERRDCSS